MGLLGAFCIHLIIGASSRWNMLNAYATSYYKVLNSPHLIINEDSYASPLSYFCMGIGMRTGIRLDKKLGTFLTCIFAVSLAAFANFMSSFMPHFERTKTGIQCSCCSLSHCILSSRALPSTPWLMSAISIILSWSYSSMGWSLLERGSAISSSECSMTSASTPPTYLPSRATMEEKLISFAARSLFAWEICLTLCLLLGQLESPCSTRLSSTTPRRPSRRSTRGQG